MLTTENGIFTALNIDIAKPFIVDGLGKVPSMVVVVRRFC